MRQLGLAKPKRPEGEQQDKQAVAAAALAAAKAAASVGGAGMITITEQRRFAGKTIEVQRDVAKGSQDEAKAAAAAEAAAAASKQAGLDSVLASLAQAKKVRAGSVVVRPEGRLPGWRGGPHGLPSARRSR